MTFWDYADKHSLGIGIVIVLVIWAICDCIIKCKRGDL